MAGKMRGDFASPDEPSSDNRTKVLKRGDLVRVLERRASGKSVKSRDEGLGRIARAVPVERDGSGPITHPFRYDVDWVLGGRLPNLDRWELVHTTAEAEGMTTDAPRRKRKPSNLLFSAPKKDDAAAGGAASKPTSGGAKKAKKKGAAATTTATATAKRGAGEKKGKGSKKDSGKKKQPVSKKKPDKTPAASRKSGRRSDTSDAGEADSDARTSGALDMYDRHRNEFERSIVRLERTDSFGFFLGKPLPGFNEVYGDAESKAEDGDSDSDDEGERRPVTFPTAPPFNFTIVRKRRKYGRYVLDRVQMELEHRESCSKFSAAMEETETNVIPPFLADQANEDNKSTSVRGAQTDQQATDGSDRNLSLSHEVLYRKGVHWDLFREDIISMCDAAISRDAMGISGGAGTLGHAANKIKEVMEQLYTKTGRRQLDEMDLANAHQKFYHAIDSAANKEAAMQGKWRKQAFPERCYERLTASSVCAGLSSLDERSAIYELETSLKDSFVGLSYTFDDMGSSEGWMKSVVDETAGGSKRKKKKKSEEEEEKRAALALAADDGVVRAQVKTTMDVLLIGVQDRVMTEMGVLERPEMRSANWEGDWKETVTGGEESGSEARGGPLAVSSQERACLSSGRSSACREPPEVAEQSVWGPDCYSRKNVELCLQMDFSPAVATEFIEKWLLPAINSCPVDSAYSIAGAARVLERLPESDDADQASASQLSGDHVFLSNALNEKIRLFGPPWLQMAAKQIRIAAESLGENFFRIHPKGHGSVVIRKDGIKANTLITYYRGEVYPPWRWGEKLDAIEQTQKRLGVRPNLPDFYNMSLERPRRDPRGFGLLFVDASRKSGLGSSFSHSCDPTCDVKVVAKDGKLQLAMTTLRDLERGEELTFDYNAVTESLHEYHHAICLCGHSKCRGSFLHFAAADCYQQVLNRNAPIAIRFSNLVKGCMKKVMSSEDEKKLNSHGFGTAAFGAVSFNHHRENVDIPLDSTDYIPIWLRTFVADTLRYIEYERRALPVALLCNHFSKSTSQPVSPGKTSVIEGKEKLGKTKNAEKKRAVAEKKADSRSKRGVDKGAQKKLDGKGGASESKPIAGSKPLNSFLYFSQKERDRFIAELKEQGLGDLVGLDLNKAIQKVAGATWKSLSDDMKQYWKDSAFADWELNGGRGKAKQEEKRKAGLENSSHTPTEPGGRISSAPKGKKRKLDDADCATSGQASNRGKQANKGKAKEDMQAHQISFSQADAEGWSAMEQRIHQLTQTLSRVGRVLDRHRERFFETRENFSRSNASAVFLRSRLHSPLKVMLDSAVVGWMYNHPQGVVRTLLRMLKCEPWASSPLPDTIAKAMKIFSQLERFPYDEGKPRKSGVSKPKLSPSDARQLLSTALIAFRNSILDTLQIMEDDVRSYEEKQLKLKSDKKREERKAKAKAKKRKATKASAALKGKGTVAPEPESRAGNDEGAETEHGASQPDIGKIDHEGESLPAADFCEQPSTAVKKKCQGPQSDSADDAGKQGKKSKSVRNSKKSSKLGTCPWSKQLRDKYKLEASADLLLIYAHTSTFFTLQAYTSLESSPVEVYARELGNAVPASLVEEADAKSATEPPQESAAPPGNISTDSRTQSPDARQPGGKSSSRTEPNLNLRRGKGCGSCSGCKREDDCGECVCCLDKPKFGGRNVRKQKCKLRRCVEGKSSAKQDTTKMQEKSSVEQVPPVESKHVDDTAKLCEPDDVITSVTVRYSGEYVLSSLLQWFTGGIGLKSGLPDMTGCVMLPSFDGCWDDDDECDPDEDHTSDTHESRYKSKIRPRLIEWFEDIYQRGSPWPEEVANIFKSSVNSSKAFAPMGSPILDFLVSGDETNIYLVLQTLKGGAVVVPDDTGSGAPGRKKAKKSTTERLQSTVDEGMPQNVAVANWVQCENPECMKWRKLPWHVDVDALPEKFFCKDNVWNPNANACSAQEDTWDAGDAPVQNTDTGNSIPADTFVLGARFDVLRTGKQHFTEGVIIQIDSVSSTKRVLFHFPKMKAKWDEWVEIDSSRIAGHMSYTKLKAVTTESETQLVVDKEPEQKERNATSAPHDATVQKAQTVTGIPIIALDKFVDGARFDVLRTGKKHFAEGLIIQIDSSNKRVLFHFPRMAPKWDEWIEIGSPRIAPHMSHTKQKAVAAEDEETKQDSGKKATTQEAKKVATTSLSATAARMRCITATMTDPPAIPADKFVSGARFDVLRKGKKQFAEGVVMNIDSSSSTKRVLFHFPRMAVKWDEWVEIGSSRIAPHLFFTEDAAAPKDEGKQRTVGKKKPKQEKRKVVTAPHGATIQNADALKPIPADKFVHGARFDVLRTGKKHFTEGVVVNIDSSVSTNKRVLFHFPRMAVKWDEWVEVGSSRIAPHRSHTEDKTAAKSEETKQDVGKKMAKQKGSVTEGNSTATKDPHLKKKKKKKKKKKAAKPGDPSLLSTCDDPEALASKTERRGEHTNAQTQLLPGQVLLGTNEERTAKVQTETEAVPATIPGCEPTGSLTQDQMKQRSQIARMKHPKKRRSFEHPPFVKETMTAQTDITMIQTGTATASEVMPPPPIGNQSLPSNGSATSQWNSQGRGQVFKVGPEVKATESNSKIVGVDTFWEEGLKAMPETDVFGSIASNNKNMRLIASPIRNEGGAASSYQGNQPKQIHDKAGASRRGQPQQNDQDRFNLLLSAGSAHRDQNTTSECKAHIPKEQMIANFWNEGLKIPTIQQDSNAKKASDLNQSIPMIRQADNRRKKSLQSHREIPTQQHHPGTLQQQSEYLRPSATQHMYDAAQRNLSSHGNSSGYGSHQSSQAASTQSYSVGHRHQEGSAQQAFPQSGALVQMLAGRTQMGTAPVVHQSANSRQAHVTGTGDSAQARQTGGAVQAIFHSQQVRTSLPLQSRQLQPGGIGASSQTNPSLHQQSHIPVQQTPAQRYGSHQPEGNLQGQLLHLGSAQNVTNRHQMNLASNRFQPPAQPHGAHPQGQHGSNPNQQHSGSTAHGSYPWPTVPRESRR